MREQIPERDGAHRRLSHDRAVATAGEHALMSEVRQVSRDRVIKLEPTLLVKHHDGDRRQRLGHRINAVDGFGCGVSLARQVAFPMTAMKDRVPAPMEEHFDARKPLVRNLSLHPALDALDPPGAQTHVLRFAGGNLVHESVPLYTIPCQTPNVHPSGKLQQDEPRARLCSQASARMPVLAWLCSQA